jgi:asparagine synthase (glutamine-hydrolysing)
MCGIAGILTAGSKTAIQPMTDALEHRGPDGSGFFTDELVALGHRRLSIIDLTGGSQPISNETGDLVLICNGEIYNSPELRRSLRKQGHRFKTETDVEVILHLYEEHGIDCVKKLRGMFAFAIWDSRQRLLFLARDHMGQKPLFYSDTGDHFLFASEPKAILASGLVDPQLDLEALWHYCSLRFLPDDHSLFKGIKKLPAASTLVRQHDASNVRKYWSPDFTRKLGGSEESLVDLLEESLVDTVRSHLLSDVRVGTFLSGGIDSTTVAAMMSELIPETVPSFSIGVREQGFSELPISRIVADSCGLEKHEELVDANLVQLLPRMIFQMDELADPYGVGMYFASRLASRTVKVALSGDGADESFAGYDRYAGQQIASAYGLLPHWFRQSVAGPLTRLIPETFAYKSLAQKVAWVHELSSASGGHRYARSLGFLRFSDELKEQLFTQTARQAISSPVSLNKILQFYDADNADHPTDKMLYTDLMTRVPDHNLVIGDRMSMAHSLEVRAPYVDHQLVEFAARIPPGMKLKGRKLKHILRLVARRHIPNSVVNRPKQGFGFPLAHWLRNDLRDFLTALPEESRMVQLGVFEQPVIRRLADEHISGKADHNFRLWVLLNIELWHRIYIERQSVDSLRTELTNLAA